MEIIDKLDCIEKIVQAQNVSMTSSLYKHVVDLKDLVKVEWKKYDVSSCANATCLLINDALIFNMPF
jgi:hypothetical protein